MVSIAHAGNVKDATFGVAALSAAAPPGPLEVASSAPAAADTCFNTDSDRPYLLLDLGRAVDVTSLRITSRQYQHQHQHH